MRGTRQWIVAFGLMMLMSLSSAQILTEPFLDTDWPTWGADSRRSHFNPNATQSIDNPAVKWVITGGALDEPAFDGDFLWVPRNGLNRRIIEYAFVNANSGLLDGTFGPFQGRAATPAFLNADIVVVDSNGFLVTEIPSIAFMLSGGQYDCTLFSPSPDPNFAPDVFWTIRGIPAYRTGFGALTDGFYIYPVFADNFGNIVFLFLIWIVEVNDSFEIQEITADYGGFIFDQIGSAVHSITSTTSSNLVVMGFHNGLIVAIDFNIFDYAWFTTVTDLSNDEVVSDAFDRPLVITSDETQVIACATNSGRVYGVNVADGTRNWEFQAGKPIMAGPSIGPDPSNGDEDTVYIVVRENRTQSAVVAIRASDGTQKWKRLLPNVSLCTPSIDGNGVLYLGDDRGFVYSLAPSGAIRWTSFVSAPVRVAPVITFIDDVTQVHVAAGNRFMFTFVDQSTLAFTPGVGATPIPGGRAGNSTSVGR